MIRELLPKRIQGEPWFRWRGGDVSRIEALSDIVFALVLTLVVLTEVPATLDQLVDSVWHLPSVVVCWALILWFWHLHYLFHRRFGLEDFVTMFWNSVLLLLILVYVYPLKFMFLMLSYNLGQAFGAEIPAEGRAVLDSLDLEKSPQLMIFYSAVFASIFLVFAVLNRHALKRREQLELNEAETFLTQAAVRANGICIGVSILSCLLVIVEPLWTPLAGMVYFLLGPLMGWHGFRTGARLEQYLDPDPA